VNKRARNRLIGVTAIILIALVAIIYSVTTGGGSSKNTTVAVAATDASLVGKYVQVAGTVVAGSWDKKTNPMKFTIADEKAGTTAPTMKVVYNGTVPTTFGDGTPTIITGKVGADKTIAATTLITKCPSKYQSATGALPVADLLAKKAAVTGQPSEVTGYVVKGSVKAAGEPVRFVIGSTATGGETLPIHFEAGLPQGVTDGAKVVVGGSLGTDGTYTATSVAIDSATQK
jgi:cytochrome c-type biogenesis protein CcmE